MGCYCSVLEIQVGIGNKTPSRQSDFVQTCNRKSGDRGLESGYRFIVSGRERRLAKEQEKVDTAHNASLQIATETLELLAFKVTRGRQRSESLTTRLTQSMVAPKAH